MKRARIFLLGVMGWLGSFSAVEAQAPVVNRPSGGDIIATGYTSRSSNLTLPVDLETLPAAVREALARVMRQPTITAVAPIEEFACASDKYVWLLDHPDRVSLAWKRLNVTAIEIAARENGRFNWQDDQGSELTWRMIAQSGEGRIWYAEGKVKPGALLPLVPVRAVAVLRHGVKKDTDGTPLIRHQVEVYLQTDSKTAALVLRMLGPTAPRMAEQGAEQLLMFFSGVARYIDRHPSRAQALLAEKK